MALRAAYDPEQVEALAEDLEQHVTLHGYAHQIEEQYRRLARKLVLAGWRKDINPDWMELNDD